MPWSATLGVMRSKPWEMSRQFFLHRPILRSAGLVFLMMSGMQAGACGDFFDGESIDTGNSDSQGDSSDMNGSDGESNGTGQVDCQGMDDWPMEWSELEDQILQLVNEVRASGATCGSKTFGPAAALSANPTLRCVARAHSQDMVEREFFDHKNPDGQSPFDRMSEAGYEFRTAGENIAAGSATAENTMKQWMGSDGHCRNIMNPDFEELGVGYYPGGEWRHMWTQVFGTSRG